MSTLEHTAPGRMAAATDYGLALVIGGQVSEAAEVFKQCKHPTPAGVAAAAGDRMRVDGDDDDDSGGGDDALAQHGDDDGDDAVTIFTRILETSLQAYGDSSLRSLSTAGNLGIMLMHAEMHDEAAALFEWTTATMTKVLGSDHPHTLRAAVNWGA